MSDFLISKVFVHMPARADVHVRSCDDILRQKSPRYYMQLRLDICTAGLIA